MALGDRETAHLDSSEAAGLRAAFIHFFILQRCKRQARGGCWRDSWKQTREVLGTREEKRLTLCEALPLNYPQPLVGHVKKLVQAAFFGSTEDDLKLARALTNESLLNTDSATAGKIKPWEN